MKRAMNTMILMQARKILMEAAARKTKASIAIRRAQLKRRNRDVHLFSLESEIAVWKGGKDQKSASVLCGTFRGLYPITKHPIASLR